MKSHKIRILLADDHAIVIEGLKALLDSESDLAVVAATTEGAQVAKLVEQQKPDVVVLDLMLGTMKGTEVIAQIRQRANSPKILVLTAYADGRGYVMIDQFTPADADRFYAGLKLGPRTKGI